MLSDIKKWQVPSYEVSLWSGKKHHYSVVIPVINEGDRIISLLTIMKEKNIHSVADIIIVDGGSSDDSLEPKRLQNLQVSGLIVKKDIGKLSAQLRCGYAFCLENNYDGIITIDGNNKDDPEVIPQFIAALQNGADFVQASRFLCGGQAINTPKIRDFAIRYIHAPLLSLASGFKWTDTTQGFRAYSRKLLLSQEVSIFRNIFQNYELLAYLSYIAPKLNFHCIELATTRIYPIGKIPTKISAIKGNLMLLSTLLKACVGYYNVKNNRKS